MKFDPETNYYAILQVDEAASGPVIHAAYQVLREQCLDEPRRRALLDQAYGVLSHPTRRQEFDAFRQSLRGRTRRDEDREIVVLCPVCQSQNVLDPLKDNRAAICGICRAKLSKDLIGKPIRQQARKNMLAIFRRKYAGLARKYRTQAIYGLILLCVAAIGTATFFGFRSQFPVGQYRLVLDRPADGGEAGQARMAGTAGQSRGQGRAPGEGGVPIRPGQPLGDALVTLRRGGWAIGSQYEVAARGGKQHIVEASRGAVRLRLYFRAGRLIESESF